MLPLTEASPFPPPTNKVGKLSTNWGSQTGDSDRLLQQAETWGHKDTTKNRKTCLVVALWIFLYNFKFHI